MFVLNDHQSHQAHYERDGYTIYRNVLDADLIAEIQGHIAWSREKLTVEHSGPFALHDAFFARLVSDSRLLAIAETYVGADIGLYSSHYLIKEPEKGLPILWHQDLSYWPLEPQIVVTLYLAIDLATPENGCMRVIPGSHRLLRDHAESRDKPNVFGKELILSEEELSQAVDIILQPGDVEVHHPFIIHGSAANTSPHRRAALPMRYIPTSTSILGETRACTWLLQGEDRGASHEWSPWPRYRPDVDYPFVGHERWI
ncbi:phytanoyl-CoA dioxygenase family protein [Chloroflexi bacterium TSY]|nr:phytanoyl-CoA dioxygenase family protein [Chloroflexi bacterium TSY]